MSEIDKTLQERGGRYGDFNDRARITDALVHICEGLPPHVATTPVNPEPGTLAIPITNWDKLDAVKRQSIRVICDKLARILSPGGDPEYRDNWHDIQGYAKLAEDRCKDGDAKAQAELPLKDFTITPKCDGYAYVDNPTIGLQVHGKPLYFNQQEAQVGATICAAHGVVRSSNSDCPMCAVEQAKIAEHRKEQDMQKMAVAEQQKAVTALQQKYMPIGGQSVPMAYCARHQNFYTYEEPCRQCDDMLKWGKAETPAELDPSDGA